MSRLVSREKIDATGRSESHRGLPHPETSPDDELRGAPSFPHIDRFLDRTINRAKEDEMHRSRYVPPHADPWVPVAATVDVRS